MLIDDEQLIEIINRVIQLAREKYAYGSPTIRTHKWKHEEIIKKIKEKIKDDDNS